MKVQIVSAKMGGTIGVGASTKLNWTIGNYAMEAMVTTKKRLLWCFKKCIILTVVTRIMAVILVETVGKFWSNINAGIILENVISLVVGR